MPTTPPLTLSLHHIETFLACRRRFRLRYLDQLAWPQPPLNPVDETAIERGSLFHRAVERHFLELEGPAAQAADEVGDATVRQWLATFRAQPPAIPPGARYPEVTLTVPIGDHYLTGRFDLLVIDTAGKHPAAHLYDWKTSSPRSLDGLRAAWQTRLYLALLAEGGRALLPGGFRPEALSFTYWFLREPDRPRVIGYSQSTHAATWAELTAIVAEIDARRASDDWPLTDDLALCRRCVYQAYDGRMEAGPPLSPEPDADDPPPADGQRPILSEPEWG